MILVWSVAIIGVSIWAFFEYQKNQKPQNEKTNKKVVIDSLRDGKISPPGVGVARARSNKEKHECVFFIVDENENPVPDVNFYSEFNTGISKKDGKVVISSPNDLPRIIHLTFNKAGYEKIEQYFDRKPISSITLKRIKK